MANSSRRSFNYIPWRLHIHSGVCSLRMGQFEQGTRYEDAPFYTKTSSPCDYQRIQNRIVGETVHYRWRDVYRHSPRETQEPLESSERKGRRGPGDINTGKQCNQGYKGPCFKRGMQSVANTVEFLSLVRMMHAYFRDVRQRILARGTSPSYYCTQALTGHANFGSYLRERRISADEPVRAVQIVTR